MIIKAGFKDTLPNPNGNITTTRFGSRSDFIFYKDLPVNSVNASIDRTNKNNFGIPTRSDHFPVIANFAFIK